MIRPRIRRNKRSNHFCGPVALSAVTGLHVDGITRWLRERRVYHNSLKPSDERLPLRIRGIAMAEARGFLAAHGFSYTCLNFPESAALMQLHDAGHTGDGLFLVWCGIFHVFAWWKHPDAVAPDYPDDWKTGLVFSNDSDRADGETFRVCPYRELPAHAIWRIENAAL
jgi:hypothetical protein